MKKALLSIMACVSLFAVSCSDDDSTNESTGAIYLPLSQGNYWVYDVTGPQTGRDSLYIANDTLINNNTYKKFKTATLPSGFFSGALSGNGVKQNGTKLQLTGSTGFSFSEDLPISLSVTDFTFFDSAVPAGTQIGIATGAFEQPTTDGYTLSIEYALQATAGADFESHSAGGETYTNVKTVEMTLTLTITALFDAGGFTIPVEVLPEQDVLTSTQYYAQNIGAVHISTDITYQLTDLSSFNVELPIPASGTEHQEEILDTYSAE
jgi:hypothetical protein